MPALAAVISATSSWTNYFGWTNLPPLFLAMSFISLIPSPLGSVSGSRAGPRNTVLILTFENLLRSVTISKIDFVSVLYVVGGIPCMIAFFLILFGLVGACDKMNRYFPA